MKFTNIVMQYNSEGLLSKYIVSFESQSSSGSINGQIDVMPDESEFKNVLKVARQKIIERVSKKEQPE